MDVVSAQVWPIFQDFDFQFCSICKRATISDALISHFGLVIINTTRTQSPILFFLWETASDVMCITLARSWYSKPGNEDLLKTQSQPQLFWDGRHISWQGWRQQTLTHFNDKTNHLGIKSPMNNLNSSEAVRRGALNCAWLPPIIWCRTNQRWCCTDQRQCWTFWTAAVSFWLAGEDNQVLRTHCTQACWMVYMVRIKSPEERKHWAVRAARTMRAGGLETCFAH